MPPKKVVKTKKAPAYQPDEEYLHNLVCAEVATQLAKRDSDIVKWLDEEGIGIVVTDENTKSHYFNGLDLIFACAVCLLG